VIKRLLEFFYAINLYIESFDETCMHWCIVRLWQGVQLQRYRRPFGDGDFAKFIRFVLHLDGHKRATVGVS
jgi:hypothetical protein